MITHPIQHQRRPAQDKRQHRRLIAVNAMSEHDVMSRQDEFPGIDRQSLIQRPRIGAMIHQRRDRRQAKLFIIRRPPRMSQRPQQRQAKQQHQHRRRQRPRTDKWPPRGFLGIFRTRFHG